MFELIFVSDGQNEGLLIMALIFVAQLALLLCGIVSVCYTCSGLLHHTVHMSSSFMPFRVS